WEKQRMSDQLTSDSAYLIECALRHFQDRRFHSAEVMCRRVIEGEPNCADAWHLLGMIADAAGASVDAIGYIQQAIKLDATRSDFYNNLGTLHEQRGELALAARSLRRAIQLEPGYAIAHNNLGEVMKELGRVGDALACYRNALQHAPNLLQASSNLLMTLN